MGEVLSGMELAGVVAGGVAGVFILGAFIRLLVVLLRKSKDDDEEMLVKNARYESLARHREGSAQSNEYFSTKYHSSETVSADAVQRQRISAVNGTDRNLEQDLMGPVNEPELSTFGARGSAQVRRSTVKRNDDDNVSHTTDSDTDFIIQHETTDEPEQDGTDKTVTVALINGRHSENEGVGDGENVPTTTDANVQRQSEADVTRPPDKPHIGDNTDRVSHTTDSDTDSRLQHEMENTPHKTQSPSADDSSKNVAPSADDGDTDRVSHTTDSETDLRLQHDMEEEGNKLPTDTPDVDDKTVTRDEDEESYTTDSDTDIRIGQEVTVGERLKSHSLTSSLPALNDDNKNVDKLDDEEGAGEEKPDFSGLENFSYATKSSGDENFVMRGGFQDSIEVQGIITTAL